MSWNALAEARIQEWLRMPPDQRAKANAPGEPPRSLELDLVERIERALTEARGTSDPDAKRAATQRAQDAETQLFTLLDATGRSILAPVFAARIDELRRAK